MTSTISPVENLFARALELPAAERAAFLEKECAGDAALRTAVEGLLRASEDAGEFLECGPRPGMTLGGYELVEEIGRGGFSTVWRARQSEPLEREVAVKMIAPGMDSREVLRRFAAERQTLARMTHPGIARVFDAGADASGRPYFVMELVAGAPLTEHCRARGQPLAERLRLFTDACAAVTHAHQRGVIHRDLKPSNILAGSDGVKVIDFGIARLLEGAGDGLTIAGNVAGTPQWMPPEAFDGAPPDVRADVFALGLLLCELVTDQPARDPAAWKTATFAQWASLAGEPVRPASTGTDLDAIMAHATEVDADQRYASVAELVDDLHAFVQHRPVRARPPTRAYLLKRFLRRHRVETIAAAVALGGIIAGGIVAWQKKTEAEQARVRAEESARRASRTSDMLERMLFAADPERGLPEDASLQDLLENLSRELPPEAKADPFIEHRLRRALGDAWMGRGHFADAAIHHARARDLAVQLFGPDSHEAALALFATGNIALQRGLPDEAIPLLLAAGKAFRALPPDADADMPARCDIQRSMALRDAGRLDEAEAVARGAIAEAERSVPEVLPRALWALGRVFDIRKEWRQLTPLARRRLEAQRALTGDNRPETWEAESFLAGALLNEQRLAEAREILERVLQKQTTHFGAGHPTTQATADMLRRAAGA
jgi:tetratricopeptide (TPR) repeat protein